MRVETVIILPHPEVAEYMIFKASHYKKWLIAIRELRAKVIAKLGSADLTEIYELI